MKNISEKEFKLQLILLGAKAAECNNFYSFRFNIIIKNKRITVFKTAFSTIVRVSGDILMNKAFCQINNKPNYQEILEYTKELLCK